MKKINREVVTKFRANDELPEGMHRDRLLLLTTTGRKSAKRRIAPMMFHRTGDELYVIASNNGAPEDPSWYKNLMKDASVGIEIADGDDISRYEAVASTVEGEKRDRVWADIVAANPFFVEQKGSVSREIPVVELNRVT